ncbi:MAG TPA: peptidoglycan-binding protein, partial [Gammaproteobacteria bacterium]
MFAAARRSRRTPDIWPGYVDALAALLMVVIFVLLIFVIAQAILSRTVSQQDLELADLHRQIAEITRQLGLAQEENETLRAKTSALSSLISELMGEKEEFAERMESLVAANAELAAELAAREAEVATLQSDLGGLRQVREALESQVAELDQALAGSRNQNSELEQSLAGSRAENRELRGDNQQLAGALSQALTAGRQTAEALAEERQISAEARAQLALLNRQIAALRRQLDEIGRALAAAEALKQEQAAEIEDLGKRLNLALAREVNRLQRYRSEFFGRLREALGETRGIRVEGDRFVFASELLFASGTADLGPAGQSQLDRLATTLRAIAQQIPPDLEWILRVDGHTDRVPINTPRFASNWELSTARAVSVVRYLVGRQIPASRLAAA